MPPRESNLILWGFTFASGFPSLSLSTPSPSIDINDSKPNTLDATV